MSAPINILMTGGGAPGAAGIIKCLRKETNFRIIAVDANEDSIGKHLADDFFTVPVASDPAFTKNLLELCISADVKVVLPLVTRELVPLATHQHLFSAAGIILLVSPLSSLEIANDKSKLYQFLDWRGIAVPAYRIVESVGQFETAVKELGYPDKTVCFKPSVSNGSRGFRIISDKINELDLLFNHKPNSTYLNFETALKILSTGKFPELLVSEYLPGEEYSIDCVVNKGDALIIAPRVRRRMINGISVEGEFINDSQVIDYCKQILHELKLHGNIGIQVKKADSGKFLILEINPRVQGTISSALGAGINLPVLAINQELGLPISQKDLQIKWGTKFVRYWEEIFY